MYKRQEQAWEIAKQRYAAVGVDVEEALRQLDRLPVSMPVSYTHLDVYKRQEY